MLTSWTRGDAWVLLSMVRGRADLGATNKEADRINHAIPNASDIDASVAKFVGSGLAVFVDGRVQMTSRARAIHDYSHRSRLSPWEDGGAIDRAFIELQRVEMSAAGPPDGYPDWYSAIELGSRQRRRWLLPKRGRRWDA